MSLYVVMVASECAPVAQAGGLGEVVFGLSRELEWRGHRVEIILPKYDCMRYDQILRAVRGLRTTCGCPGTAGRCTPRCGSGSSTAGAATSSTRTPMTTSSTAGTSTATPTTPPGSPSFARPRWSSCTRAGRRPDVIHCHDWQTGLVPVLLYEMYQHAGMHTQRVCYTIHNFSHQGVAGENMLWATGLSRPEHFYHPTRLQDDFNPRRHQPDEGRHRLFELRHHRLAAARVGGRATPSRAGGWGTRCTSTTASSAGCSTASTTTCGTPRSTR